MFTLNHFLWVGICIVLIALFFSPFFVRDHRAKKAGKKVTAR